MALLEPLLLLAVTVIRRLEPTSALESVIPLNVSPAILTQLLPALSQRRHWYL